MGVFATFFAWVGRTWTAASTLGKINMVLTAATLAVGVKGYMQQRAMLAKGQDILANKVAAGGKLPIVYGSRRTGAQIIYMDTAGNSSTHLYVVYAISVGECEEIMGSTIELSGNSLRDRKQFRNGGYIGTDKISSGSGSLCTANQNSGSVDLAAGSFGTNPALGGYRYVMNIHHGQASQTADPMLRASIGSQWTTAHRLDGVAYIACSFIYDAKGQFRGVPQLTVQVKGRKVFDPRDNSTAWSDNPALVMLDYITNSAYGKGLATSQINMSTFSAAANKADTLLDIPYFGGNTKPLNWSGSAGDNFITIGGSAANDTWWQNKVGNLIDLYDTNGNGIIDGKEISALQRDEFFDENPEFIVYFNGTLGGSYANQSGSYSAKSKRFHCNAYIDGNKTVMENARELLANMRGLFLYIDGKYELQIEDTGSSTFSINDSHIIGDSGISVDYGNKDAKANVVICEFFNANKRYEMDTATVYHTATTDANDYTSDDDGEILEIKAEFPHTTSAYIAYNHAKTILTRSRAQTSVQFLGTPEMYKLKIGDIVNLTYSGLGFNGKIFRVEAMQLQSGGLVSVSLLEYFDVYTWTVPPQEATEALSNIPSAYAVKAPASITFTDSDASSSDRPFLSWALPTDYPYYQWRVNVVDSSGVQQLNKIVDINNVDLNFIPVGANYVASVTALNTMGVESNASTKTFTVGDPSTGTPDIKDGAITNVKVLNLSAAKINTGELNLGTASGMSVRQNKTGYSSNAAGFWLGNDGGTAKFNIGNSSSFLRWDGSALNIAGSIAATTGVIGGFTVGSNSLIAGSGTSRISLSTATGIHLGNNTFGSAPFRVSLAGALVATNATISGAITATTLNVTNATVTGTLDASVITLNGEPLSNLMSYSSSGSGSITLLEVANINGDFVVNGNFEATGTQPDLVIGKVYNVSNANDRTIQADARLVSTNGSGSFVIQQQVHNNATLTTKAYFQYDAFGNTTSLGTAATLNISSGNALSLTLDTSQNATFTGEVTADAIQLPVQTPSSTTNKIYNVGGALYFNGAAVGGGGDGDITAVVAGTNLTGGGTSGSVTLNLANAISISGAIASGAITTTSNTLNKIRSSTDGSNAGIEFSTLVPNYSQKGNIFFNHLDSSSYGSNASFTLNSSEPTTTILADGKLMFKEGLYVKPSSGTGAGTQIITSSRNLVNIGTVNSGAITTTNLYANDSYDGFIAKIENDLGASGGYGLWVDTRWNTSTNIPFKVTSNSGNSELFKITGLGAITANGTISQVGAVSLNSNSLSDPDSTSRTRYPAGQMLTHIAEANGVSIIGGQGNYQGCSLTIGEETGRSANFKLIRGISDTNGSPAEEFSIDGVGNAVFAGTINSGAITATGDIFASGGSLFTGNGGVVASDSTSRPLNFAIGNTTTKMTLDTSGRLLVGLTGASGFGQLEATTLATVGQTILARTGGKVGIGLTNPAYKLHQSGTGLQRFQIDATDNNANGSGMYLRVLNSGSVVSQSTITIDNAGNLKFFTGTSSEAERMRIDGVGNAVFAGTITSGAITSTSSINSAGGYYVSGTEVIDASRNLTNIGTIASAGILAGNINITSNQITSGYNQNNDNLDVWINYRGYQNGTNYFRDFRVGNGKQAQLLFVDGSTGVVAVTNDLTVGGNASVGLLKIGTTTVLDGSRNLKNITSLAIGTASVTSGFGLEISNVNEAAILIRADTDNVGEDGNAIIKYSQDNTIIEGTTGYTADNHFAFTNAHNSSRWLFQSAGTTKVTILPTGAITSADNITAFSDERLKTNIQTLDPKLALKMRGVSFTKDEKQGSGVIAQEIEKIAPELVLTADDEIGTKSVAYGNLVGYLIETVKDQQKQIDELKELIGAA